MKRSAAVLTLGLAGLLVQGLLGALAPGAVLPDLGFLVVIAAGLCLRASQGLLVSAAVGYAADMLSGSLLGQHSLLRVLTFTATRFANLRLNLVRPIPRVVFVGALTLADGLALLALTHLFGGHGAIGLDFVGRLLGHAVLNAALAPLVLPLVHGAALRVGGEERAGRRPLRLEPRRGGA